MKVIIPAEYIYSYDDGIYCAGKDVEIDPKEITAILWQDPYSVIKYRPQKAVVIDLQVYEVCALVADAMRENPETLILTEKDS